MNHYKSRINSTLILFLIIYSVLLLLVNCDNSTNTQHSESDNNSAQIFGSWRKFKIFGYDSTWYRDSTLNVDTNTIVSADNEMYEEYVSLTNDSIVYYKYNHNSNCFRKNSFMYTIEGNKLINSEFWETWNFSTSTKWVETYYSIEDSMLCIISKVYEKEFNSKNEMFAGLYKEERSYYIKDSSEHPLSSASSPCN